MSAQESDFHSILYYIYCMMLWISTSFSSGCAIVNNL